MLEAVELPLMVEAVLTSAVLEHLVRVQLFLLLALLVEVVVLLQTVHLLVVQPMVDLEVEVVTI
tara:strand:- start:358 stop:549 length:192 start_codon:yes stop_codon:yes gene_type:complete